MLESKSPLGEAGMNFAKGMAMEQAGSNLEGLLISALRRVTSDEAPVLAWPLVCGSVVSELTRALDFTGTVLRVEVPSLGWKREMQHLAPHYVATLNRYTGQKVERVEFVIRQDEVATPSPPPVFTQKADQK
jgi:Dna[CI] antecedent, DciA